MLYGGGPSPLRKNIGGTSVKKVPELSSMIQKKKDHSPNSVDYLRRYKKMMEAQKRNAP